MGGKRRHTRITEKNILGLGSNWVLQNCCDLFTNCFFFLLSFVFFRTFLLKKKKKIFLCIADKSKNTVWVPISIRFRGKRKGHTHTRLSGKQWWGLTRCRRYHDREHIIITTVSRRSITVYRARYAANGRTLMTRRIEIRTYYDRIRKITKRTRWHNRQA